VVQTEEGETCDDGINDGSLGSCSADCLVPFCGDGERQPDYEEASDDGVNSSGIPACGSGCSLMDPVGLTCDPPVQPCGDGVIEFESGEECDDGVFGENLEDDCDLNCKLIRDGVCGDGTVNVGYEECDDGNLESCDGCSAKCQAEAKVL
jgi:cysteine-rich repeat protein